MHGLLQPRLEHKSTVKNKCFDRGAEHIQPQSEWHQSRTITVENARNSGPGMTIGLAEKYSRSVAWHSHLHKLDQILPKQLKLDQIGTKEEQSGLLDKT